LLYLDPLKLIPRSLTFVEGPFVYLLITLVHVQAPLTLCVDHSRGALVLTKVPLLCIVYMTICPTQFSQNVSVRASIFFCSFYNSDNACTSLCHTVASMIRAHCT
jgi:hypothetical protein